ncbi:MAG: tetratricopeptide repeat protein [Candidatus Firestonebacteria bacterium]
MIETILAAVLLAVSPVDTEIAGKHYLQALEFYGKSEITRTAAELTLSLEVDPGFRKSLELKERLEKEKFREGPENGGEIAREYYEKGLQYFRKGDKARAAVEWRKGTEACPFNLQFKEFLLQTEREKTASSVKKEKPAPKAAAEEKKKGPKTANPVLPAKHFTAAEKEKIESLYFEGLKLYKLGKPAEALSKWEQVLKLDPLHKKAKQNIENIKKSDNGRRPEEKENL